MFDFSSSSPPAPRPAPPAPAPAPAPPLTSVFNLAAPAPPPQPPTSAFSTFTHPDPWASNNAWATPDPAPAPSASKPKPLKSPSVPSATTDFGWGASTPSASANNGFAHLDGFAAQAPLPKIAADEDFGGWTSAAPVMAGQSTAQQGGKPQGGFGAGGSEDLFSNVWE